MQYIAAGYNMLTDIVYADQSRLENSPGGSWYAVSGLCFWRRSVAYVGTAGPDFMHWYGEWFRANAVDCRVEPCLPETLHYSLEYRPDGIWSESCLQGEAYEARAKEIGQLTPAMFAACTGPDTRGIYVEASLSARIANRFPELKALIPDGILLWEINGDDLRDPALHAAIEERISQVDAFSMNLDEARCFFQTEEEAVILSRLQAYEKPCFFRLGERGAGLVHGSQTVFAPAIRTDLGSDPTGCGNCSTAASLIGLAEGLPAEETVLMANLAASYCARQTGPVPRSDDETRCARAAELRALMDKTPFTYGRMPSV